jgi:hypothetical protein
MKRITNTMGPLAAEAMRRMKAEAKGKELAELRAYEAAERTDRLLTDLHDNPGRAWRLLFLGVGAIAAIVALSVALF